MADKIPTYEKQILPPKQGPAVETPFAMDEAAKAQAYGAKTLEQSAASLYWASKDLKQLALKERKDKQAADFAYLFASTKKQAQLKMIEIMENTPYEQWAEKWEKERPQIFESALKQAKDPEVAQALQEALPSFLVTLDVELAVKQAEKRHEEGQAEVLDALNMYVESGDMEGFLANLTYFKENTQYFGSKKWLEIEQSMGAQLEKNVLIQQIMASPYGVDLDKVETKYLDAEDIYTLKARQRTMQNALESERNDNEDKIFQSWMEEYINTGYFPTPKEITEVYHQRFKDTPLNLLSEQGYMQAVKLSETIHNRQSKGKKRVDPPLGVALKNYQKYDDMLTKASTEELNAFELIINRAYEAGEILKEQRDDLLDRVKNIKKGIYEGREVVIDTYKANTKNLIDQLLKVGAVDESGAYVLLGDLYGVLEDAVKNTDRQTMADVLAERYSEKIKRAVELGLIKPTDKRDWITGMKKKQMSLEKLFMSFGLPEEEAEEIAEFSVEGIAWTKEVSNPKVQQSIFDSIHQDIGGGGLGQ